MLDDGQDSKDFPPSIQYEILCNTTQQMKSRNHQANGWQTNRPIPRHGHILLLWVSQMLRVLIGDERIPCLFHFCPFPYLCFGCSPCLHHFPADLGENHPSRSHHCLLTSRSGLSFLWTTKQSPLLTTILDLVLVLRVGMLFRSSFTYLCLFLSLFLFPFLLFTWWALNGLDCQAYSLLSHVQKHDLSSSMYLALRLLHLLAIVQIRLHQNLPR